MRLCHRVKDVWGCTLESLLEDMPKCAGALHRRAHSGLFSISHQKKPSCQQRQCAGGNEPVACWVMLRGSGKLFLHPKCMRSAQRYDYQWRRCVNQPARQKRAAVTPARICALRGCIDVLLVYSTADRSGQTCRTSGRAVVMLLAKQPNNQ